MRLEDLTNVHARRHTEWVKHDIYRLALLVIRHVFYRHNYRDNTLVTMTTGHLVARLNATLDSEVNFNDLQYTRSQIITLSEFLSLVFEALV